MALWQKRDIAKEEIQHGLRQFLIEQYRGHPVVVLRDNADEIRQSNKAWVRRLLKRLDCQEYMVKWTVFFTFMVDSAGVPVVKDFEVVLDAI
jgi:hypothetical protein